MNILYTHRTQGGGAEGVHIREMIFALKELDHNVETISPPGIDPFKVKKEIKNKNKPKKTSFIKKIIYSLPQICFEFLELGYNLWLYFKLKKIFKNKKFDFIYERYSFFCFATSFLAKKLSIPFILEVNEISGIKRQRPQTMIKLCTYIENKVLNNSKGIIVVSQFLKERLIKSGINPEKIHIFPNAVNIKEFDYTIDSSKLKKELNLLNKFIISFVGMFSHWDRLDYLLEVFSKVHKELPHTHLLIVGEGIQRQDLMNKANDLGISNVTTFTGEVPRNDIPYYISLSDICLLSDSNPFGSPMTLFEYMAMEKAVIVPKYGPIEAIIKHKENGILFNPKSEKDFCEKLSNLINDEAMRLSIGRKARETIFKNHLWTHNANNVIKILKNNLT